jgi:chromosomal replication initiation ATPase DnaA
VSEHSDATLTELGQWLGRDVTTLSSAVRRLREKAKKSEYVVETQEQIMRRLDQFATLQA